MSADFAGLSAPVSAQISIVTQEYTIIRVDKESVGLNGYNIVRVIDRNGRFYGKEDVIAVEGETLY